MKENKKGFWSRFGEMFGLKLQSIPIFWLYVIFLVWILDLAALCYFALNGSYIFYFWIALAGLFGILLVPVIIVFIISLILIIKMNDFLKIYGKAIWIFLKKTPGFLGRIIVLYVAISFIWYLLIVVFFKGNMGFMVVWGLVLSVFVGLIFLWYLTIDSVVVAVRCLKLMKKFEISEPVITKAVFEFGLLNSEHKDVLNGSRLNFDFWFESAENKYDLEKQKKLYKKR